MYTLLNTHPKMEAEKEIDAKHVIVDKEDYEHIISFFDKHPEVRELYERHKERLRMRQLYFKRSMNLAIENREIVMPDVWDGMKQ